MKRILLFTVLITIFMIGFGQEKDRYLVFIFNTECETDQTGDYMWIIPFDSCSRRLSIDQMKPLFAHERLFHYLKSQDFLEGFYPIYKYSKSDTIGWYLFQKRRLIEEHCCKIKFPEKMTITRRIYLVPIVATCEFFVPKALLPREIVIFKQKPELWSEFWSLPKNDLIRCLRADLEGFEFQICF